MVLLPVELLEREVRLVPIARPARRPQLTLGNPTGSDPDRSLSGGRSHTQIYLSQL